MDVVPHADLIAVVDDGAAGQCEQQAVHELNLATVIFHQGGQAAGDADVASHERIRGIGIVHVVPLLARAHL